MKDEKVREIIIKLINDLHFELTQDNKDKLLDQALSQLNALKPKIDEKLLEACKANVGILNDIANRHQGASFNSQRVKSDATEGIEILQKALNQSKWLKGKE